MIYRCDLVPQFEAYKEEINEAIQSVLSSGRYILGENVEAFEHEFATYIGVKYAVGVNSGTDALLMALSCFNLQAGDEVITTPFTAIPTYSALRHVGAKPIFVDIKPDTFLMNIEQVYNAITPRTKAIIPVHLFGNALDIERLREIVGKDIFILEDCAQSHGAMVRSKMTGSMGDISAFSFYPTKNLGAYGDGGIVLTDNKDYADSIRLRRMYGMINKDAFIVDGTNTRLDELQAAILRVKLRHLDEMNTRRSVLAALYAELLSGQFVHPQVVCEGMRSVYHVYSALTSGHRDQLITYLESQNIQSNVYYPIPLYSQKAYRNVYGDLTPLPVVEKISKSIIALPFYPEISEDILQYVAKHIHNFYQENAKQ